MIFIISLIIALVILLILFWKWSISPLFIYEGKLSHNIKERVFPHIVEIDKTAITLSSAAIVITVSLLKESTLIGKEYLLASWISFSISILFGVFILVIYYTQRLMSNIVNSELEDSMKGIEGPFDPNRFAEAMITKHQGDRKRFDEAMIIMNQERALVRILFVFIYLQTTFLFAALVALVVFGINNIMK
ncbi:MAG: hypothetical protein ABSD46_06335 [Bacteroidota bacterium]